MRAKLPVRTSNLAAVFLSRLNLQPSTYLAQGALELEWYNPRPNH